jgi:inosine/xanthosine triphosphate pyrophosphatase family protein
MNLALRHQLLRAMVRDPAFLKSSSKSLTPVEKIFTEPEEKVIAQAAVEFYEKYQQSIGPLLISETDELARTEKFGTERKKKLAELRDLLQSGKMELVSVKALEDRVKKLKRHTFYETAVEEIVSAYEQGKLGSSVLSGIVERANVELSTNGYVASSYFDELQKRLERRKTLDEKRLYPSLMIGPLDDKIKIIGRGQLAMFLAPPASGKGLALVHVGKAYAMHGLNVMHITLEDPRTLVEDRYDAALTGIAIDNLDRFPNRLKTRFEARKKTIRGRIRIIDGTEEGWTVTQVEKAWEHERQNGFVSDVVIVDYDDELVCEKQFKGDSQRRFEFAEIYKRMRRAAARLNVFWWTAAQTGKQAQDKKIITGKDAAEDYSKIRKVFLAIGIGHDPKEPNRLWLNVLRHRLDRSKFAVKIVSDFDSAIFYDQEATNAMIAERKESKLL